MRKILGHFADPCPGSNSGASLGIGASRIASLGERERAAHWAGLSARVHGVFASAKNAASIPWATQDQRDLMYLLELDPLVRSYEARPERVSFVSQRIRYDHVPAFRITTDCGQAILDVHPTKEADSGRRQHRLSMLREVYAERGVPYRAFSGREIRTQPRLGNAIWAVSRQACGFGAEERLLVTAALTGARRTIRELEQSLPSKFNVGAAVAAMAIRRMLVLDLAATDPMDMTVRLSTSGAV